MSSSEKIILNFENGNNWLRLFRMPRSITYFIICIWHAFSFDKDSISFEMNKSSIRNCKNRFKERHTYCVLQRIVSLRGTEDNMEMIGDFLHQSSAWYRFWWAIESCMKWIMTHVNGRVISMEFRIFRTDHRIRLRKQKWTRVILRQKTQHFQLQDVMKITYGNFRIHLSCKSYSKLATLYDYDCSHLSIMGVSLE